jgi:PEP-CTERM motif-containing protein
MIFGGTMQTPKQSSPSLISLISYITAFLWAVTWVPAAHAVFMALPGNANTPCGVGGATDDPDAAGPLVGFGGFNWTFTPTVPPVPPESATIPPPPGAWTVSIFTTPGVAANSANLDITIKHLTGFPVCDFFRGTPHGPNANEIIFNPTMTRPAGVGGQVKAEAEEITHGAAHFDIGRFSASVVGLGVAAGPNGELGQVLVKGEHGGVPLGVVPSFRNPLNVRVNVTTTPDYRKPKAGGGFDIVKGPVVNEGQLAGNTKKDLNKLKTVPGQTLASYEITASGSPTTHTTLAFLGEVDGIFSELDLAAAIHLFVGLNEYLVPMLRNDSIPELFVAVDLVQWLSFPTPFQPFDVFDFVNGVSDSAPGFLVATSEITLGPAGYQSANLATGQFFAAGIIDGRVVPEPGTWLLLAAGLAALLGARRSQKNEG